MFFIEYVWKKDKDCVLTLKFTSGSVTDKTRKVLRG